MPTLALKPLRTAQDASQAFSDMPQRGSTVPESPTSEGGESPTSSPIPPPGAPLRREAPVTDSDTSKRGGSPSIITDTHTDPYPQAVLPGRFKWGQGELATQSSRHSPSTSQAPGGQALPLDDTSPPESGHFSLSLPSLSVTHRASQAASDILRSVSQSHSLLPLLTQPSELTVRAPLSQHKRVRPDIGWSYGDSFMSKVRYLGSPYEDSPYRDMWNPGDQAHFEYHCHRGHDSEDYPLWYRSHQPVTIMNRHETDLDPYLRGEKAWRDDEFGGPFPHTPEMRMDYGMPFAYQVKFPDHHQGTVMEDELYTHPRYFDPQGGPPSYEEQMQNHPEHAQRLGSHKRAFSPSFYHVAPAAKRSACCHPQRTCGRSRTWLEDTAQMFEHRLGRRSFKQSAKVPVNYHGQIDPLNEMGNLKGYAGRWPTLYDGKAVHIGPEGSVHLDLRDELGVDQGWNSIRLPPETGMTEGWIGPNGDKDSGDYEDEYGGDRYTPGTKVGWYDEGHVPHPDVEMSAYNYWKTFLKPDISPDTPGGYGHGPKLTNWQFKQSIQTPMSYDPTRCASCGGLMSEPKMVGNQWMNRCTRCGRTRVVPTTSPALQQYQQNFPAYPEALRAVGPERPWFTSKQAQGPVWSPNTLELDPGPMGDTLRDAIKGSRWQFLYRTSEPDWGGDYRHTYDMVPVGAPASHFYQGNYGERSNKTYAYDPEVAEPVDGEFRTDFNWKGHPVWQREAYREPEAEGWGLREPFKEQNPPDPNMLYRGLSHEEWEDAKQRGYFRSTGEYNIGGEPTGSTMFSSDPRQAESYAVGFAPWHRKPGFTTPSYVIATPRSAEAYAHPSLGTEEGGNTEIIVPHPVPFDQVSQAWQFKPYAMEHGEVTLGKDAGRYYRAMGQKSGSGQHMWRPMDPAEWQSRQSNWGAGKISQVTKGLSQKISQPCFPQGVLTP